MRLSEAAELKQPVPDFGDKEIPLTGVVDVTMQDAANQSLETRKELEKRFKDQEKEKDAFVKSNHERDKKVHIKNKELKKMHLSEAAATAPERTFLYRKKREPLADIIQMELAEGETGYYLSDNNKPISTWGPSLNLNVEDIGIEFEDEGDCIVAYVPDEDTLDKAVAIADKYDRAYKTGFDKYVKGNKHFIKIYLEPQDWSEPYFDPDAPIMTTRKS